jgi:hypothetical protein
MVGDVGGHDHRLEVVTQVEHVVVDAEGIGHPPGIVHVRHGTAA